MNRLRFWTIVFLLAAAAVFVDARPSHDRIPARIPLADLPTTIDGWTSTDLPIDAETRSVLGDGDFLSRNFTRRGQPAPINVFLAYFSSQRTGSTIHSPKHCLPGSGWTFLSARSLNLKDAIGQTHRVGEYTIGNGPARDFVIYWYEAHGRSVASEYMAKIYLVADALRTDRTDGALVRIITPIRPGEDASQAQARAEAFARQLAPLLTRSIPN